MIPPMTVDRYPGHTLEGQIVREFVEMISEIEDAQINLEPIQELMDRTRSQMREAGWSRIYQHNFLVQLRNDLTELTRAHPVTRQFVVLLTIEAMEF